MFFKRSFQGVFGLLLVVIALTQIVSQRANNMLAIILIMGTSYVVYTQLKKIEWFWSQKCQKIVTAVLIAFNILMLLYVSLNFQINDVSDPLNVQIKATELLHGNYNWHTNINGSEEYFYFYPNVVFYTIFLSKIMSLGGTFGLSIQLTLRLMTFLFLAGITVFAMLTSWQLNKNRKSLLITALILAVYPVMYLYPNMVTYTDTLTMFLTTVVLYLIAVVISTRSYNTWFAVGGAILLVYAVLYAVKPNMIVLLPAVLILLLMTVVMKMKNKVQIIVVSASLALGIVVSTVTITPITQHYGFDQTQAKKTKLPVTHWINMGLNPVGSNGAGAYDLNDDNNARQSIIDNNPQLIKQSIKYRLKTLGIGGIWKLALDKAQMLLGTPLFGFGKYMTGYAKAPTFYIKHQSMLNALFSIMATTVILIIVTKLFVANIKLTDDSNAINQTKVAFIYLVGIASIGLAIFHTVLWEVEPRYFLPLLYPMILLVAITFDDENKPLHMAKQYDRKISITIPVVTTIILILTLEANRNYPSVAFGNMEYPASVNILQTVNLRSTFSFKLNAPQDIDVLKVNIQPQDGLQVTLKDGTPLLPQNNQYVIEKHFTGDRPIEVKLQNTGKGQKSIVLYRKTNLFKTLFHGTSITDNGNKYYLPYEMDVYDRKTFQTWNYQSGIPNNK